MQAKTVKKYLRINDVAYRYGVSRSKITKMINDGELPEPMILSGVKVWPVEVIEKMDRLRDDVYYDEVLG